MTINSLRYFAPALGWGIFVFTLSVWPGKDFPKIEDWLDLFSVDKVIHMAFYAFLTWLILRGYARAKVSVLQKNLLLVCALAAAASAGYGWLLEWIQDTFCADRLYEFLDGVANTIGAFASGFLFFLTQKRRF